MLHWFKARLCEPSTYGGLAGVSIVIAFMVITFWPRWRDFLLLAGVLFIVQAILAERGQ